jgi:hypothetical protein
MEKLFPHRTRGGIDIIDVSEFFIGFMMIDIDDEPAGPDIFYPPIQGAAVQKNAYIACIVLIKGSLEMLDSVGEKKIFHDWTWIIHPDSLVHVFQKRIQSQLGSDAIPIRSDMATDQETVLLPEHLPDLTDDLFKILWIKMRIIFITLLIHVCSFFPLLISDGSIPT